MEKRHETFTDEDTYVANKYVERCSALLAIREKQIKTTIRYHYLSTRMFPSPSKKVTTPNANESTEKLNHSYIVYMRM